MITNDACQRPKRLIHRRSVGKHLGHVWLKDDNVTTSHASGVRVTPSSAEVVLRQNIIAVDARRALGTSLLHSRFVRDESLSER